MVNMKRLFLIATLTCSPIIIYAQIGLGVDHVYAPNLEKMQLKGNVRTLLQYKKIESMQIEEKLIAAFDSIGRLNEVKQLYGDTFSTITNFYIYDDSLLVESKIPTLHSIYHYNEFGKTSFLIKIYTPQFQRLSPNEESKNIDLTKDSIVYVYNINNELVKKCEFNNKTVVENNTIYTYNNNSQVVKVSYFNKEVGFGDCIVFKYNKLGEVSMRKDYDVYLVKQKVNKSVSWTTKYFYNREGQIKRIKHFDEGKLYSIQDIVYDSSGNPIEEIISEINNAKTVLKFKNNLIIEEIIHFEKNNKKHVLHVYEFDEYGNWIVQTSIHDNGNRDVTTRQFEYYSAN